MARCHRESDEKTSCSVAEKRRKRNRAVEEKTKGLTESWIEDALVARKNVAARAGQESSIVVIGESVDHASEVVSVAIPTNVWSVQVTGRVGS